MRFKVWHIVLVVAMVFLAVLAVGLCPRLLRHLPLSKVPASRAPWPEMRGAIANFFARRE